MNAETLKGHLDLLLLAAARTPTAELRLTEGVQAQASHEGYPRLPRDIAGSINLRGKDRATDEDGHRTEMEDQTQANPVLDQLLIGNELHDGLRASP